MNFLQNAMGQTGLGAAETVSTLASGDSILDAGKNIAKRAMSKKFEGMFVQAADAYVAGYSSTNMAMLGAAGISASVTAAVWGSMKGLNYLNERKEEEEQSHSIKAVGLLANFVAFIVFALVFIIINTTRRQKMFSSMAGENMVNQYVKFFTIPLVLLFVALRVMIPSESIETYQVFLLASGLSGVIVALVKKFYFIFKINDLEKTVFETIASVFEECSGSTAETCGHEHAGFITVFNNINSVLQHDLERVFGDLNFADIAREISKSQKFDTFAAFTG